MEGMKVNKNENANENVNTIDIAQLGSCNWEWNQSNKHCLMVR